MKPIKLSHLLLLLLTTLGIGLALLNVKPAQAVVVLSNLTTGDGKSSTIRPMTKRAAGFTIPADNDFTLNFVTLQLANIGSSDRSVVVEIWVDGNKNPGELVETLHPISLAPDAAGNFTTEPPTPLTLSAGKTYWLVVYATNNSQWIGSEPSQPPSGLFGFVGYQSSSNGGVTWSNSKNPQSKLYIDASAPGLPTSTITPTPTASVTPTPTNTFTITPSRTPRPTRTPRNTATHLPTRTPRSTTTPTPSPTNTLEVTAETTATEEMSAEILGLTDSTSTVEATAEMTTTADSQSACEVTTIVASRMRQSASTTSATVAGVPEQTTLRVLSFQSGWYQVTYLGTSGWISSSLVVTRGNCG